MRLLIILSFITFSSSLIFSQSGEIKYELSFKGTTLGENVEVPTLTFNQSSSVFTYGKEMLGIEKSEEDFEVPKHLMIRTDSIGNVFYKDFDKGIYVYRELIPLSVNSSDSIFQIKWNIENDEIKQICKYDCLKATCHYEGRDYVAWFSNEIPFQIGPWKLHGLPGAILELYEVNSRIHFTATSASFRENHIIIKELDLDNVYSYNEYKAIYQRRFKNLSAKIQSITENDLSLSENVEVTTSYKVDILEIGLIE